MCLFFFLAKLFRSLLCCKKQNFLFNVVFSCAQTPMQTPMQTPLPGSGQTPLPGTVQTPGTAELYNIPTGGTPFTPGEYPSESGGGVSEIKPGRPSQFMVTIV